MFDKQMVDHLREKARRTNGQLSKSEFRAFISGERSDLHPTETRHAKKRVEATPRSSVELKSAADTIRTQIESELVADEISRLRIRASLLL
jgi:hypothetical protein